jgi:hypothetical protein
MTIEGKTFAAVHKIQALGAGFKPALSYGRAAFAGVKMIIEGQAIAIINNFQTVALCQVVPTQNHTM